VGAGAAFDALSMGLAADSGSEKRDFRRRLAASGAGTTSGASTAIGASAEASVTNGIREAIKMGAEVGEGYRLADPTTAEILRPRKVPETLD
jgi:hypothetical protein